jgi:hypothetical protein
MTCVCGYAAELHDALGKCPLCACGELPGTHEPHDDGRACSCACGVGAGMHAPPGTQCEPCDQGWPHACVWARWEGMPCPGRRSKTTGNWLMLRQGSFRTPDPEPERVDWYGMSVAPAASAEIEELGRQLALADAVRPPQVAARPPAGPGEVPGGTRKAAAVKLGRAARAAGWLVEPLYWRAADGTEGCMLRLAREPGLRMVALWKRKAGNVGALTGWSVDVAYGWRVGSEAFPTKLGHADVERLLGTC